MQKGGGGGGAGGYADAMLRNSDILPILDGKHGPPGGAQTCEC